MTAIELRERGADINRLKSNKQRQFALEWLVDQNATQAAIRAGYSKKTANVNAMKLTKNPIIKAFHGKFIREQCEALEIKAGEAIRQLYFALTRQVKDFCGPDGIPLSPEKLPAQCQSIVDGYETKVLRTKTSISEDGEDTITEELVEIKYKLTPHASARQQALQHKGLFEPERVEGKLTICFEDLVGRPDVIIDPVQKALANRPKALKIIEEKE